MSFVRPEVRELAWRWREAIAGFAIILLGIWMATGGRGILAVIGAIAMVLGIALAFAGWQRARFRQGRGGAGVVYVTEGQITYYGPLTGGALAIAGISDVILLPGTMGAAVWEIRSPSREPLFIPVNAEGAEALFDAFGALEGFPTEDMLGALNSLSDAPQSIWSRRLLH